MTSTRARIVQALRMHGATEVTSDETGATFSGRGTLPEHVKTQIEAIPGVTGPVQAMPAGAYRVEWEQE